jgi:aminoglycoside phosphotransferase (APT) family kinase protein
VLELADIEPYLRDRGLISARAVVDGGLRIVDVSRLNRVFLATAEHGPCLVVKTAKEPGSKAIAREAAALNKLWAGGAASELTRFLPPIVSYDGMAGVLVLRASRDARDLSCHHAKGRFSRSLARQAGRALAALHDLDPSLVCGVHDEVDQAWSLRLHRPDLDSLYRMSAASIELTSLIQDSDRLCSALDEMHGSWTPSSATHGDIRWDNFLVLRGGDSRHWTRLQLIDWELAGAGDPACDIGAFFGEYLRAWLQSIPIVDVNDPGRLLVHASLPLSRMRPALGAFWDGYARKRSCPAVELTRLLKRAIRFAGAGILLAAVEEAQVLDFLPANLHLLTRVGQNILERPETATADLLGLGDLAAVA